jgi:hypothetical protein
MRMPSASFLPVLVASIGFGGLGCWPSAERVPDSAKALAAAEAGADEAVRQLGVVCEDPSRLRVLQEAMSRGPVPLSHVGSEARPPERFLPEGTTAAVTVAQGRGNDHPGRIAAFVVTSAGASGDARKVVEVTLECRADATPTDDPR